MPVRIVIFAITGACDRWSHLATKCRHLIANWSPEILFVYYVLWHAFSLTTSRCHSITRSNPLICLFALDANNNNEYATNNEYESKPDLPAAQSEDGDVKEEAIDRHFDPEQGR